MSLCDAPGHREYELSRVSLYGCPEKPPQTDTEKTALSHHGAHFFQFYCARSGMINFWTVLPDSLLKSFRILPNIMSKSA